MFIEVITKEGLVKKALVVENAITSRRHGPAR